jgi:hypothetical protein
MNTPDYTQVILTIVSLVLMILTAWVTKVLIPAIARWGDTSQQKWLRGMADTVVKATEQWATTPDGQGKTGKEKYEYARDQSVAFLNMHGINVTEGQLRSLIEESVHELRLEWARADAPPLPKLSEIPPKSTTAPRRAPAKKPAVAK